MKTRISVRCLVIVQIFALLFVLFNFQAAYAAEIPLPTGINYNGGFELTTAPNLHWTREGINNTTIIAQTQTDVVRTGTNALELKFVEYIGDTAGVYNTMLRDVKPNTDYYFEAWVKSDFTYAGSRWPQILFATGLPSYTAYPTSTIQSQQDWTRHYTTFNSGVNNKDSIRVRLLKLSDFSIPISGSIYVDDVLVVERPTQLELTVPSQTFFTTSEFDLSNISIKAYYGTDYANLPSNNEHIIWTVPTQNASINGGKLIYQGDRRGETVTVQAEYHGRTGSVDIVFEPEFPYYVGSPVFMKDAVDITESGLTNGLINCKVEIENFDLQNPRTATMILCLYNGDVLENFSLSETMDVYADGTSKFLEADITVSDAANRSLRVFVWDAVEGMQPLKRSVVFNAQGLQ